MVDDASPKALAGLRVLDMATLFAAPMIGAMLGDLGADVVKVEPASGDPLRRSGATRNGGSVPWALAGRNKRDLTVDLDAPKGLELVHDLASVADVILLNQPRHVLERWRCTPEALEQLNPRAVVVWMTAYGSTGPYAERPGNGTLGEAFAGITNMTGQPDGPPVLPSVALGDTLA